MPLTSHLDLLILRKSLGLSHIEAAQYLGQTDIDTWTQYEYTNITIPYSVTTRILSLFALRNELEQLYLERMAEHQSITIPFFHNFVDFQEQYPNTSIVAFSVYKSIMTSIYTHNIDRFSVCHSSGGELLKLPDLPEIIRCDMCLGDNEGHLKH